MTRRPRHLSADERALWHDVAKTAEALPGKTRNTEIPAGEPAAARPPVQPAPRPARPRPVSTAAPKLAPIEKRLIGRVARGSVPIDARVDLHGLTQREAHLRLARFLGEAQARGSRLVLVITGKGRPDGSYSGEERGVLRRGVPLWLAAPDLRPMVIGFEEAHATHGGAGALYVRLRRRRLPSGERQ